MPLETFWYCSKHKEVPDSEAHMMNHKDKANNFNERVFVHWGCGNLLFRKTKEVEQTNGNRDPY